MTLGSISHNSPSGQESWCVVLDCCMLKPVLVPLSLRFARFHQSSFFINLGDAYCNTIDMAYSHHGSDDIQCHIAINIMQFNLLAILTQNQIPWRYTSDFPILPHHPPSAPRSLSKSNPTDGFASARGRNNPDCLPQHIFYVHYRDFIPIYST